MQTRSRPTCPSSTSLMFTTLVMHDVIAHEGRLCRSDNLKRSTATSGGGREGGLTPSR